MVYWFLQKAHSCNFRSWSPWTVPIVVGILQRINTLFDNLLCVLLLDWKCETQILSFPFVIFILWFYNLNHSFTYLLFFSTCPLKAPSEPPPFSMPSKWLTLYGKAKSYCLTTSCVPESMFNYLKFFHSDFLCFDMLRMKYNNQALAWTQKQRCGWLGHFSWIS